MRAFDIQLYVYEFQAMSQNSSERLILGAELKIKKIKKVFFCLWFGDAE